MVTVNIFEYASGGGFQGRRIPRHILCEGYGMLKTAAEDFQAAGYTVRSFLDPRLRSLRRHLNADETIETPLTRSIQQTLAETLRPSELSLIIAPETGGVLSNLVRLAGSTSTPLNSTPEAIDTVSDKARLVSALERHGLPVPETTRLSVEAGFEEVERAYRGLSGWVVVKPIDGVGCESVSLVKSVSQLREAIEALSGSGRDGYLVQRFVEGVPASVSLITNGEDVRPIGLNLQRIFLNPPSEPSSFRGGLTPLSHPDRGAAFDVAKRAVSLFRGLKGYVGVDLILSPRGPVILEINPRLTVSYVGLKRVSKTSLAEAMARSARGGTIPSSFELEGVSVFSKLPSEAVGGVRGGVEVLCPRLRLERDEMAETLLVCRGRTEAEAQRMLPDRGGTLEIAREAVRG